MAGITLAQAQAKLTLWLAADDAVSKNQQYTINNRTLSRANAKEIRDNITFWDNRVSLLSRRDARRNFQVVPIDG
jgi:hypothetical protein